MDTKLQKIHAKAMPFAWLLFARFVNNLTLFTITISDDFQQK